MFELNDILKDIKPLDSKYIKLASQRQSQLLKPAGSLGTLEDISVQIAGITGKLKNSINKKILFLFGSDNGVYDEGIAGSPKHFTNLLMSCYASKMNCAINVICDYNNVHLKLIDVGIIGKMDYKNIENKKLMEGTNNFCKEKAMTIETVHQAIEIGFSYAKYAYENNYDIIGNGEVGIGNTTTATACIMASLGITDTEIAVGRGAGLTDQAFSIKKDVIKKALNMHLPNKNDSIDILSKVGGLDIAAITGLYIGAAYYKIPIVIDGVVSISAAILAYTLNPLVKEYMIPSHNSEEPSYKLAALKMSIKPMLNLGMRLGEGTGCPLAMTMVENAIEIINSMSTFEELEIETQYREKLKMK